VAADLPRRWAAWLAEGPASLSDSFTGSAGEYPGHEVNYMIYIIFSDFGTGLASSEGQQTGRLHLPSQHPGRGRTKVVEEQQ
jgi:hypothetical protein